MSGVTGNQKIQSRENFKEILDEYTKILQGFDGFVSVVTSGSYNANLEKTTFGDIDLILQIDGYDKDVKKIKVALAKYLSKLSDEVIVPFESEKYKGRRYYNSGEIITVSYQSTNKSILPCQIDNIIAVSVTEALFKKEFLDLPAEKQGLVLGLMKTILIEEEPKEVFDKLDIKVDSDILETQEYEFNLSSKEIQLRLVTYSGVATFKEINKEILWSSKDWSVLLSILDKYNLTLSFDDLIKEVKRELKYPRSSRRMLGVFKSMISIKSGEVGKEKGFNKQKALDKVQKVFGESLKDVIKDIASKRSVVYTFGRFNPFTKGHQELWNFVGKQSKKIRGEGIIYPSFSQDADKNPLRPKDKIKYMKRIVEGVEVSDKPTLNNPYDILEDLLNRGYTNIQFVVGADRRDTFNPLKKYAEEWSDGKAKIEIITFSEDRISDYSGTKMRESAKEDDYEKFSNDLPVGFTISEAKEIFEITKRGLNEDER